MAELEHVTIDVEAALAQRLHQEAELLRAQGDAHDRQYRDMLAAATTAEDTGERQRLRAAAERVRQETIRFTNMEDQHRRQAARAVIEARNLDDETDPATIEPVTRRPFTDEEAEQHATDSLNHAWVELRAARDGLLARSDWTQAPDTPADSAAWAKYRQRLRDLPAKTTDPATAKWPKPPTEGS